MTNFTKLDQIRRHLGVVPTRKTALVSEKRVQKNLSILERDAMRLKALAKRGNISQARLLSLALDAYENLLGKRN